MVEGVAVSLTLEASNSREDGRLPHKRSDRTPGCVSCHCKVLSFGDADAQGRPGMEGKLAPSPTGGWRVGWIGQPLTHDQRGVTDGSSIERELRGCVGWEL